MGFLLGGKPGNMLIPDGSMKLTNRSTCKLMVGKRLSIWGPAFFSGANC